MNFAPRDLESPKMLAGETLAALLSIELILPPEIRENAKCVLFFYAAYNKEKKQIAVRDGIVIKMSNQEENEDFKNFTKNFGFAKSGPSHEIVKLPFDMKDDHQAQIQLPQLLKKMQQSMQILVKGIMEITDGGLLPNTEKPIVCRAFGGDGHQNNNIKNELLGENDPHQKFLNEIVVKEIGLDSIIDKKEIGSSLEMIASAIPEENRSSLGFITEPIHDHQGPISTEANESAPQMAIRLRTEHNALLKKIIDTKDIATFKAIKSTLSKPEVKMLEDKLGIIK